MRTLGIVPARGGSRGIPRKNIRDLGGRPLIAYTAEAARAAKGLDRVVVSTEDAEIAEVARGCGLEVPFLRPEELARDDTPMLPVVRHALDAMESGDGRFDAVCLLQPTSPFRRAEDIDACIVLLQDRDADAVVTVRSVPPEHNPYWVYLRESDGLLRPCVGAGDPIPRRQDLPPAYHRDGSIYVTRRDVVERGSLYGERVFGYECDPATGLNLDENEDWERAERLLIGRAV